MPRYTRRQFLAVGVGTVTIGSTAGCTSRTSDASNSGPRAQSSFFVFGDFATEVAGETATAETLVPIGQHGHGWEPGPQVQGTVLESDLFIYGMDGFQPWADDLIRSLSDDADIEVVAAGSGIDRIEDNHDHSHEEDHGGDGSHDGEHEKADGHSHGDPHFWLDPRRAKKAVDTVRSGFAGVDSANADTYTDNADEYRSRLDELDSAFQSALENAARETVLVGGHNAFRYLGQRYGFEVKTLTGLSPDERPTPKDIERAQQIIAEHDLEHVCVDPLESQTAANQLVEETDAREVLPLTPIPGQTQEWTDKGWGYVEIMENVNLDTLETALDAE